MVQEFLECLGFNRYKLPEGAEDFILFFNGRYLPPEDYEVSSNVLTIDYNCLERDAVYIVYIAPTETEELKEEEKATRKYKKGSVDD